jgi:adenylate kinase family enzyme
MIFGDTASGKSTFANRLSDATSVPVFHLDEIMDEVGRDNPREIGRVICSIADQEEWIIEGNAFTKDPTYRIERSDSIFAFDFSPKNTMLNHVSRYAKIKIGAETRIGSDDNRLNLSYFLPYVYKKFPDRKNEAIEYAKSLDRKLYIFSSRKHVDDYIKNT